MESLVTIVLVSEKMEAHAMTYMITEEGYYTSNLQYVKLDKEVSAVEFSTRDRLEFTVPLSGIYWVSFRAHGDSEPAAGVFCRMAVYVDNEQLLEAKSDYKNLGTTAAAFWLGQNSMLTVRVRDAETLGQMGDRGNAYLSVAYLSGNRKPNTGEDEHIAYTGMADLTGLYRWDNLAVSFGNVLTNYGGLYGGNHSIGIKVAGYYLVSIRILPNVKGLAVSQLSLRILNSCLMVFAQGNVEATHTLVIALKAGEDVINVNAAATSWIDSRTMLSVALVQPLNPPVHECVGLASEIDKDPKCNLVSAPEEGP